MTKTTPKDGKDRGTEGPRGPKMAPRRPTGSPEGSKKVHHVGFWVGFGVRIHQQLQNLIKMWVPERENT